MYSNWYNCVAVSQAGSYIGGRSILRRGIQKQYHWIFLLPPRSVSTTAPMPASLNSGLLHQPSFFLLFLIASKGCIIIRRCDTAIKSIFSASWFNRWVASSPLWNLAIYTSRRMAMEDYNTVLESTTECVLYYLLNQLTLKMAGNGVLGSNNICLQICWDRTLSGFVSPIDDMLFVPHSDNHNYTQKFLSAFFELHLWVQTHT